MAECLVLWKCARGSVCISGVGVSKTDSPRQILFSESFFPVPLPFYFSANQPTKLTPTSSIVLALEKNNNCPINWNSDFSEHTGSI